MNLSSRFVWELLQSLHTARLTSQVWEHYLVLSPGAFSDRHPLPAVHDRIPGKGDTHWRLKNLPFQIDHFLLSEAEWEARGLLYYLTHWDVVLCNTFITASSGILLLTTIHFYKHHHHHQYNTTQSHPAIHVILTVISSFLLLLPRFMEFTITEDCRGLSLNSSGCVCSDFGLFLRRRFSVLTWLSRLFLPGRDQPDRPQLLPLDHLRRLHRDRPQAGPCRGPRGPQLEDVETVSLQFVVVSVEAFHFRFSGEMSLSHCTRLKERLRAVLPVYYWSLPSKRIVTWNPATGTGHQDKSPPRPAPSENAVNTLRLLTFMATEFIVTNIPMAVVKICLACGLDSKQPGFKEFQTLSIVLEVFFAASDFYIFCFCHKTFRKKVSFSCKIRGLTFLIFQACKLFISCFKRKQKKLVINSVTKLPSERERKRSHLNEQSERWQYSSEPVRVIRIFPSQDILPILATDHCDRVSVVMFWILTDLRPSLHLTTWKSRPSVSSDLWHNPIPQIADQIFCYPELQLGQKGKNSISHS